MNYLIGQKFVGQNCRNFSLVSKILSDEKFCSSKILIFQYKIQAKIKKQNCRNFGLVLKILTDKVIFNRESIINLNRGGEEMTRTRFFVGYFWRAWEIISSEVVTIERKYGALACDLALRQISNTTTQLEQKFLEKLKRKCQKKSIHRLPDAVGLALLNTYHFVSVVDEISSWVLKSDFHSCHWPRER